jgi:hypothetical protein
VEEGSTKGDVDVATSPLRSFASAADPACASTSPDLTVVPAVLAMLSRRVLKVLTVR